MPFFGYDSISDMFDGGGAGGSGSEHYSGTHEDYRRDYEDRYGHSDPNASAHGDSESDTSGGGSGGSSESGSSNESSQSDGFWDGIFFAVESVVDVATNVASSVVETIVDIAAGAAGALSAAVDWTSDHIVQPIANTIVEIAEIVVDVAGTIAEHISEFLIQPLANVIDAIFVGSTDAPELPPDDQGVAAALASLAYIDPVELVRNPPPGFTAVDISEYVATNDTVVEFTHTATGQTYIAVRGTENWLGENGPADQADGPSNAFGIGAGLGTQTGRLLADYIENNFGADDKVIITGHSRGGAIAEEVARRVGDEYVEYAFNNQGPSLTDAILPLRLPTPMGLLGISNALQGVTAPPTYRVTSEPAQGFFQEFLDNYGIPLAPTQDIPIPVGDHNHVASARHLVTEARTDGTPNSDFDAFLDYYEDLTSDGGTGSGSSGLSGSGGSGTTSGGSSGTSDGDSGGGSSNSASSAQTETVLRAQIELTDAELNAMGFSVFTGEAGVNDIVTAAEDGTWHQMFGNDGNDSLTGASGNDMLAGGEGNDILDGGAGDDLLQGGSGDDSLFGGEGGDTLFDDGGNDYLFGNQGDDVFEMGGEGADTANGASGLDTVSYATASSAATIRLDGGANGGAALGDTLLNIENATGSAFDDYIIGNGLGNRLDGGFGDDTLVGGDGADTFDGGANVDTVQYGSSSVAVGARLNGLAGWAGATGDIATNVENLTGSAHNDTLAGNDFGNVLRGADGDDELHGYEGDDTLIGGNGDDTLFGNQGRDVFELDGTGADHIDGGGHLDVVKYTLSNQAVVVHLDGTASAGGAAGDTYIAIENVIGSDFDDIISGDAEKNLLIGGLGNDSLYGGGGNDALADGEGDDLFFGQDGDDSFVLGATGNDTIYGGSGTDTATYALANEAAFVRLDGITSSGAAAGDTFDSVENVIGSAYDDTIMGGVGANRLEGGDGDDLFLTNAGADTFNGGAGWDTVSYADATSAAAARLNGVAGNDAAWGDVLIDIEHLIGSDFGDALFGSELGDSLEGGEGNDSLYGGLGNDTLSASNGDNLLNAGLGDDLLEMNGFGADTVDGGDGIDTVSYAEATTAVYVNLDGTASGWGAAGDTFQFVENATGSNQNDVLVGDATANVLEGGLGNDSLYGGSGSDTLIDDAGNDFLVGNADDDTFVMGSAGADTASGGGGIDTVTYADATSGVVIRLDGISSGTATDDTFLSIEEVIGTSFNDTIVGDAGTNFLHGGDGDDRIEGGGNYDTL